MHGRFTAGTQHGIRFLPRGGLQVRYPNNHGERQTLGPMLLECMQGDCTPRLAAGRHLNHTLTYHARLRCTWLEPSQSDQASMNAISLYGE